MNNDIALGVHQLQARRRAVVHGNGKTEVQSIPVDRSIDNAAAACGRMGSLLGRTPVCAAMTTEVTCVRDDVSLEALLALFVERSISGAPVVDARGFAIGVVSKSDVVRELYENGETLTAFAPGDDALGEQLHETRVSRGSVADIMTPLALTVFEQSPLANAAALMAFESMHRVPVVSESGKVVGILSALDVLRWLAEHEGYMVRRRAAR